jgi:hypothetical protein
MVALKTAIFSMVFVTFTCHSIVFAQSDSIKYSNSDNVKELGLLEQFAFSSVGYAIGFLPGGYYTIGSGKDKEEKSPLWVVTAPILSSLGTDLAKTNFWRKKNVVGSFWGGIIGGLLGELGGMLVLSNIAPDINPFLSYTLLWMPSSLMTVLFYNLIGEGLAVPNEPTNMSVQPFIGLKYGGVNINMRF